MLKISEYLSADERQRVLQRSDLQAWWLVLSTWAAILGLLALAAAFPHPVTVLMPSGWYCPAVNWDCPC